jgi:hypothetical protein
MGKRDELIAKYADDLKNKCNMTPNMDPFNKGDNWMWSCDL